jgi:dTDP-4-dehydrorhamnose reductase
VRVLVTGCTGLIGLRTSRRLAALGHEVTGMARVPVTAPQAVRAVACDARDAAAVGRVFDQARPDVVVHAAALADVAACERDPALAWAVNVEGAAVIAAAARRVGAHLVHLSTDYVFDGRDGPYAEEARPSPSGAYAVTKHASELAVRALAGTWAIARTAVVYGHPPSWRPNFGSWLVGELRAGRRVTLFSDQQISPTFAGNAAEMISEVAVRRLEGTWHLCGADVVLRPALAQALVSAFDLPAGLLDVAPAAEVAPGVPRPLRAGLLTVRAARELGARPLGLAESVRRFREEVRAWEAGT